MGPIAPLRHPDGASIPARAAALNLTLYQAWGTPAVLGPAGWHCVGSEGSSGDTLVLTPERYRPNDFIQRKTALDGPAIEISYSFGDTSGRFTVAEFAARLFPKAAPFVQSVLDEGIVNDFPTGPYPTDRLTYRGDFIVEYVTPPDSDGLGTRTFLRRNADPIEGVVLIDPDSDDLVMVAIRLPAPLRHLAPFIIETVEKHPGFR
jgi:hypothetical protein